MMHIRYAILTDNKVFSQSMRRYFRTMHHMSGDALMLSHQPPSDRVEYAKEWRSVTQWLDFVFGSDPTGLCGVTCVISLCDWYPESMCVVNKWTAACSRYYLVARLILAYPEIEWVFLHQVVNCPNIEVAKQKSLAAAALEEADKMPQHTGLGPYRPIDSVISDKCMGLTALFDGDGTRATLCHYLHEFVTGDGVRAARHVRSRDHYAVSIDEETAYAFLAAYVAYRKGYRAHVATTLHLMQTYVQDCPLIADLYLEDIFLNFEDRDAEEHLSDLSERNDEFSRLTSASMRIVLTYGTSQFSSSEAMDSNKQIIHGQMKSKRHDGVARYAEIHVKPFAGVYALDSYLEQGHLYLERNDCDPYSPNNSWPPEEMPTTGEHSAPGPLLSIANILINRARTLLDHVKSTEDAVHGAILSMSALELLGGLTPTSSLEALNLLHQFEAMAECQFFGIGSTFDVVSRIEDIKCETEYIAQYFDERDRQIREMESREQIISSLIRIYRQHNQFDEEWQALACNRDLAALKRLKKAPYWKWPFEACRFAVTRYASWLMKNTLRFGFVLVVAPVLVAVLCSAIPLVRSWLFATGAGGTTLPGGWNGFSATLVSMFALFHRGAEPVDVLTTSGYIFVSGAMIYSLLNVGLFISHLYSRALRR